MRELKVYISVDFEGAACVVGEPDKTLSESRLYEETQRIVTGEANAAIEGCLAAGATEVLVNDAHDGGVCMLHEQIHPEAKILLGTPRPRRFLGLDSSFAGVMLVAYHPMAGVEKGVLSHSYSGAAIQHMWLNGRKTGEMGFDGECAGTCDVPVILVSSCAEGCREAREFFGNVETVITKWGLSRNAAISLSPAKAREQIRAAAQRACERIAEFQPYKVDPPYEMKTRSTSTSHTSTGSAAASVSTHGPTSSGRTTCSICCELPGEKGEAARVRCAHFVDFFVEELGAGVYTLRADCFIVLWGAGGAHDGSAFAGRVCRGTGDTGRFSTGPLRRNRATTLRTPAKTRSACCRC